KMPSTRSGASMTREEFEELVTRRVAEEMEAREAAMTLEPLNENGDELEGENGGNGNGGNGGNGNRGNGGNGNGNRNGNHGMNYGGEVYLPVPILIPKGGGINLTAYSDSDWLGCPITRRSRTGYLLLLGGAHISWKSKKQSVVSRSSAEAEYRAMANAVSEVLWMRWLLSFLKTAPTGLTPLFCDNQAVRHIANNLCFRNEPNMLKWTAISLKKLLNNMNYSNGNLSDMVTSLKKKLSDAQTEMMNDPFNKHLKIQAAELLNEYVKVSNDELKLLQQKAKIKWLSEGDQNTPYFHSILKSRKYEGRIDRICDENGKSYDGDKVAHVFVISFCNDFLEDCMTVQRSGSEGYVSFVYCVLCGYV
ncbi:secreted RxLR effector protein 161-like protein, partial [Tanacetum coccineum]